MLRDGIVTVWKKLWTTRVNLFQIGLFGGRGVFAIGLGCECCLSCWQTIDSKWVVLLWTIHFSRASKSTCMVVPSKTSLVWLLTISSFCYFNPYFLTAPNSLPDNIYQILLQDLFQNAVSKENWFSCPKVM